MGHVKVFLESLVGIETREINMSTILHFNAVTCTTVQFKMIRIDCDVL